MYICSNSYTLYILYIVTYTLHYIIAYMVTLSFFMYTIQCYYGMRVGWAATLPPLKGGVLLNSKVFSKNETLACP